MYAASEVTWHWLILARLPGCQKAKISCEALSNQSATHILLWEPKGPFSPLASCLSQTQAAEGRRMEACPSGSSESCVSQRERPPSPRHTQQTLSRPASACPWTVGTSAALCHKLCQHLFEAVKEKPWFCIFASQEIRVIVFL